MRDRIKDLQQAQSAPNADVPSTKRTNLDKLSKSQLIELLSGNIAQPITPEELYRAAASIVAKWCDDVIKGNYASMYELTTKLDALKDIYNQR